jgi:hypothetical protein
MQELPADLMQEYMYCTTLLALQYNRCLQSDWDVKSIKVHQKVFHPAKRGSE